MNKDIQTLDCYVDINRNCFKECFWKEHFLSGWKIVLTLIGKQMEPGLPAELADEVDKVKRLRVFGIW